MLDLKLIRDNPDKVKDGMSKRGEASAVIDRILELDGQRRALQGQIDQQRQERNEVSKIIGQKIKAKEDADSLRQQMRQLANQLKAQEEELGRIEVELNQLLLNVPNLPHPSVPVGKGEHDNKVLRQWGEKPEFSFTPRPHWELAESLGLVDFKRGAKLSGSNFVIFTGMGAKLQRALINFMLDLHIDKHGYKEVYPPFLVGRRAMLGTGQLPKLEEDMYLCEVDDLFLNPTAEVPVTNLYQDEVINGALLPLSYVAYTACFRREAGSYGKETRGLTRIHQFDKVELVKFTTPETSYEELESMLNDAEEVLQLLGLHYQVVELCTAELGFAAAKCFDLEVWAPAMDKYLEVSSCSNFEDFQARRANIRFRPAAGGKLEFPHTMNASGVALPRTVIALLETYQQADGTIVVPEPLRAYVKTDLISPH